MDPALLTALAASVFTVLQPHLSELAKSAAGALGKKVPDAIGALWGKLRARFADKPAADEALKDLLANPDDSDVQGAFRVQLKKLLQDDAAFADEIKELVDSAGKQTSYTAEVHGSGAVAQGLDAVAAGEGGMAIGGDVHGDVNVQHGDRTRHGGVDINAEQVDIRGDVIGGDKIEHQTRVEQVTPSLEPGSDPVALRNAYLNRIFDEASHLSLAGIDPKAAAESGARLNLGAVYTALRTLTPETTERTERGDLTERESRRLTALEQLNKHNRLVLLGDPGSGKSTFVNFAALCLAGEALGHADMNLALLRAPLPAERDRDEEPQAQPWEHRAIAFQKSGADVE